MDNLILFLIERNTYLYFVHVLTQNSLLILNIKHIRIILCLTVLAIIGNRDFWVFVVFGHFCCKIAIFVDVGKKTLNMHHRCDMCWNSEIAIKNQIIHDLIFQNSHKLLCKTLLWFKIPALDAVWSNIPRYN